MSDIEERAMRILHQPLQELVDEWDGNSKELLEMKILEKVIRGPIDSFAAATMLMEALRSYLFSLYVSSVLLATMAIEIGLREFVQRWFTNFTKEPAISALPGLFEELDFRRVIEFCKSHKLLGNSKEDVYDKLHACYNLRNKYSHAKFSQVSEKGAKQPTVGVNDKRKTGFGLMGEDPFLKAVQVHVELAHDDAQKVIRLVAESLDVITRELAGQTD